MLWNLYMYLTSMVFMMVISLSTLMSAILFLCLDLSYVIEWEFFSMFSCNIEFTIILDWISMMFLSFVAFISAMVLFYSGEYMKNNKDINRFMYLVLAFVFSMGTLICSPNMISILLGWDGLGLVSYVLVIYYQNEKSANAGMLTVLSNRVGDVAILLSIALMFSLGSWNFLFYTFYMTDNILMLKSLIMLAAMTKSAQIPFSAWLPAAMAAPTPVSALVHSSTLVTAGVYLLIRFSMAFSNSKLQPVLLIISSLTMFMAGMGANFEYDLKKIIALSTLSQLGVMISILALGFPMLAFFHLLTHALFKALLFMCAGVLIHNIKDYQDIRSMGNLAVTMPLTTMCMNLANLALCGIPFMAGFYSKDLILEIAFMSNINFIGVLLYLAGTGLTVCYTFRLIYMSMTGIFSLSSFHKLSDEDFLMTSPMIILGLSAITGGSVLSWLIFPDSYLICLTFMFKMLTLLVSFVGGLFGYLFNLMKFQYKLKSLFSYPMVVFSGSMWFMPFLSTFLLGTLNLKGAKLVLDSMDSGWSEFLGGQGIYTSIMSFTSYMQTLQDNMFKLYMKSFFFWVIIVGLLMI
uniref:NADH dehydrogenase subunit 5 n=1 Tax=Eiconaxius baja TaxID=2893296 RepID=UPI001EE10269|nr:NADH dehydrogenase subunit 5 [Eiconaxius baja]UIB39162.1 NADH dehydrogenase subunit 5 [Eiconaxius baja]